MRLTISLLSILITQLIFPNAILAQPSEVFIYYANESAPEGQELANLKTIIEWLKDANTERALRAVKGYQQDGPLFTKAVDEEIDALAKGAQSNNLNLVIATNRLVRSGHLHFMRRGQGPTPTALPLTIPPAANYLAEANPLAQPRTLRIILAHVAQQFDPQNHRFTLVTKSHGQPGRPLTIKLPRRHEDISRDLLIRSMRGEQVDPPPFPDDIGTTVEEYFASLNEAGEKWGMQFDLVFIESCRGEFNLDLAQSLPENVAMLVASGKRYLEYQTLDYPALFAKVSAQQSFTETLQKFLKSRYLILSHQEKPWYLQPWIWLVFCCVVGLLVVVIFRRLAP